MRQTPAWTRRDLLRGLASLPFAAAPLATAAAPLLATPSFTRDPFSLGVASGYTRPDGMVLWTRLAPEPLGLAGGMPSVSVPVRWEVAWDPGFRQIAAAGTAYAEPDWAHSVHVEPSRASSSRMAYPSEARVRPAPGAAGATGAESGHDLPR